MIPDFEITKGGGEIATATFKDDQVPKEVTDWFLQLQKQFLEKCNKENPNNLLLGTTIIDEAAAKFYGTRPGKLSRGYGVGFHVFCNELNGEITIYASASEHTVFQPEIK